MAYAVTTPRHLAPTVGPSASAAGVSFRTGLILPSGERVASGLVWRFGSLDCVSDNAGCFADRPFPAGGNIITFGAHDVYVATIAPPRYPQRVRSCTSPPPRAGVGSNFASPCVVQEVMATGDNVTKNTRSRGPKLECNLNADGGASGSGPHPPPQPSRLEATRAEEVAAAKRQLEITTREYNRAHVFTPARNDPSRAGQIRRRGGALCAEINRDGEPSPAVSLERPIYNTPEKNVRAATAAAEELSRLEGEELRRQTRRVAELLRIATEQQKDPSQRPAPAGPLPAGPRVEPTDARDRIDRLVESRIAEEEGPAGPKCFGPCILSEPVIDGFQLPRDTPRYDGTAKPEDWLLDYTTAVGIARGNKRWAVRYSPLMLLGSARTWLNNLPAGSINGWLDFEEAFVSNFTGTYRRPGRPQQLEMCKQGPTKMDREYLTWWCEMRNSCEGVHEIQAISFFMAGYRPNTMLWHKLPRSEPKTMAALMAIADKYALAEEAGKTPAEGSPAAPGRDHTEPPSTSRPMEAPTGAAVTTTAARGTVTSRIAEATYIIFTTEPEDKTSQHRRSLEVNAVMPPVPQYLNWSEQAITFDRRDQPAVLPRPGGYAMVLDPTFGTGERNVRFSRVIIDGGSSINILYRDTARKLGIQESQLSPTPTIFHGIMPGHSCQPIGQIKLDVMFGKPNHFRTEAIEFEVVDLVSPYHALLGRPALARFMAVPHYGYLKMKIPGPKGVITIAGDYRRSMECATQSSKMAQTLVIAAEKQQIQDAVAMAKAAQAGMPAAGNPAGTTHFQPANDTKKILLDPAQPDKFVTIGADLDSK
ncbi:hypothetical protein ACQ4PT_032203 [Festuca glaucescens]